MSVVAIVQARMSSSRLPGKVLAPIEGVPMLARVLQRVQSARRVTAAWVACADSSADDPIADACRRLDVPVFRGSEFDVLGRYVGAADAAGARVIVRVTADCPLLDGGVIDRVVEALAPGVDYATNVLERSFPRGLDVEAFSDVALARMNRLGHSPAAREHVTIPIRLEHPELFTTANVRNSTDDSDLRWTVDTRQDLEFVRLLYRTLGLAHRDRGFEELVRWCRANREWARRDEAGATWDPSPVARRAVG